MASNEAQELVDKAFAGMASGDGDPIYALAALNRALKLDGGVESAEMRQLQGLLLVHQRREASAVEAFARGRELDATTLDIEINGMLPREAYVEALCRLADKMGDGDSARTALELCKEASEPSERLREQSGRANLLVRHMPWSGSLFDLLPESIKRGGELPQRQPILNDTAPAVGEKDPAEALGLVAEQIIAPLRAGDHAEGLEAAAIFLGERRSWKDQPIAALKDCNEADFVALALAGHAAVDQGELELGLSCLRAVVCQAPFRRLFRPGTSHSINFAGERLRILLTDEHRGLRFARLSSGAKIEVWLRDRTPKSKGLLSRWFG